MAERIDVMISSTARDLPDYRRQAMDACVRQGMFPIMMEHLPAMDDDAISASIAMVDEAEIYLGIIAQRYGHIPKGHDISITEMEYNHAKTRGIPCLIFIMDEKSSDATPTDEDAAKTVKLSAFKDRLKADQVVNFFETPADMRAQIINSLSKFYTRQMNVLHRSSLIPAAPEPYIAHPYTLLETEALFGRQKELDHLTEWIKSPEAPIYRNRLLNIVAIGGMGKSSLTWKWFNDIAPNESKLAGRLWWSFYESDAHFENFVTRALAYVSSQSEAAVRQMPLPERESQLLNALNQKPFLFVLDGLERILIAYSRSDSLYELEQTVDPAHQRMMERANKFLSILGKREANPQQRLRKTADPRAGSFLRKLATVQSGRVLASTRLFPADLETQSGTAIPGADALFLGGLADPDALKLWRSMGVNGTDDALTELFQSFHNYPLLIRALAGEVSRYRRAPGDFDAWRTANSEFNPFELPMVQRQSHILQFALTGLEDQQIHVLRTIAAFNSPATYAALVELMVGKEHPFETENSLDDALTELEDRGLLGWDRSANRYDLHPVVRGVVWSGITKDSRSQIYEKLHSHFAAIPVTENWREMQNPEELAASIELFHTLIGLERYDEASDLLSNKLYRPLRYRFSNGQQLANLLEMFFPDDKPLPKLTEASKQAWTLNALAQAYQMTGQPGRAVPLFERSNQHKEKASYTVDLSSGLRDLAYAQRLVGGLRYSEVAARRALLIDRREENRLLEAISLQVLGLALAARGRYDESEKALDRSLDLADRTNANRAYNHQAMRALWFGDHSSAMDWSDKGIIYCKQRKLEAGLILANRLQGEAALGLKDLKLAEERLTYAIAEARAVIFVEEELAALIALAELRRQQGDLDTARALLEDVWHAAEHGPYRLFHADACNVLAYIERDAGNNDAAVQAALKAFSFSWCDGPPYAYHRGLMQAQTHLGVLDQPEPELEPFDPDDTMPMVAVDIDPKGETA
jgi:hypothetical protein